MPLDDCPIPLRRSQRLYADVIVPRHIAKAFTYLVPAELVQTLEIGHRVLVPFGQTMLEGAVISLSDHPPMGMKTAYLKEIHSLANGAGDAELSSTLFELSRKIAEQYVAPWGQCLRLVLPPTPTRKTSPLRYVVTDQGRAALNAGNCPARLRPILDRIARRSRGLLSSTLQQSRDRNSRQAVDVLEKKSWITVTASKSTATDSPKQSLKSSVDEFDRGEQADQSPSAEELPKPDPLWVTHVAECLRVNQARRIVLHAPWEHRVNRLAGAIQQAHAMNKSAIILSGEMARAEWLGHLLSTLTKLPITFFHTTSGSDRWKQAQDRTPSVVVGTRSAIFAPLRSIGLIWVDGEDDPAFKEPQEPRYHARDVACMRAEGERALVVLASAHPSLESKIDAGAETYTVQPETACQPEIELVDLRNEPGGTLFSRRLLVAMREAVENKTGVLLFLNRKGYAGALVCRDCGGVPRCPSCAVALTYYREVGRLTCRYCGLAAVLPDSCPTCQASRLSPVGEGTERVEVEARRLFPHAKIARFDGDTLRRSASARHLWEGVRSGAWDILIGTQVLFQRGPVPHRGLVGILHADSGLNIPDFRAAERTYHMLVDAVSLARPASAGGRVLLQTRFPTHHAVLAVLSGEPNRFYEEELTARRLLSYPPACHLAGLSVSGKDLRVVETAAKQWKKSLEQSLVRQEPVMIVGPVPMMGGRPKGHHRYQMLVKGVDRTLLCRRIHESVERMEREYRKGRIKFVVDVDPVEMG
ncbi:MAG: primosomal protein N' [Nitrospira sp.]|nr:MAG: primosomal protein N' [Nitrospira sp.]